MKKLIGILLISIPIIIMILPMYQDFGFKTMLKALIMAIGVTICTFLGAQLLCE